MGVGNQETANVGITGGSGFLGWHTACRLLASGAQVRRFGRADLQTPTAGLFNGLDALIHCAGVNRGDPKDVFEGNLAAARSTIEGLRLADRLPQRLVYANSTQAASDNPYGNSKRQAGAELAEFCAAQDIEFFNVLIPNVFGEGGRPFYNSFVATFCHQLSLDEPCTVDIDREVPLAHAQDVARVLCESALHGAEGYRQPTTTLISVSATLAKLTAMRDTYRAAVFPDLDDPFDVALFNTLRSYLYAASGPVLPFKRNTDNRGWLVETVKAHGGGQTFVSSTEPGITRGQHYHLGKVERFVVLAGSATIRMRRLFSSQVVDYPVTGDEPCAVEIPTLHTHSIINSGESQLLTLFWSNELFDPENPDTYGLLLDAGADL